MDGNTLSDQQQLQASLVAQAYLQDTAREQQRKLEMMEGMYTVAHNGLVSFLTLLDPDFVDTCLKQGQTISKLDDRVVQQRIIVAIKTLKEQSILTNANQRMSTVVTSPQLEQLEVENHQLRKNRHQAQQEIPALKQEN